MLMLARAVKVLDLGLTKTVAAVATAPIPSATVD